MYKPQDLKKLAVMVMDDIKNELRAQGHYDTGRLEQSMTPYAAGVSNETVIQAYAADYIMELEHGVPANKIKISNSEFEELKGWVRRKIGALSSSDATSIAAAIVSKWKKEGKPLNGSVEYSPNGEVLGAMSTAYDRNEGKYINFLDDTISDGLDKEFLKTKSGTI
jgi:hypothetical protein